MQAHLSAGRPIDTGVECLKRLRLTSKLFDWLVDASHFFDGDCDADDFKNFPGVIPRTSDLVGSSEKGGTQGRLPRWQNPAYTMHWLSLRCLWSIGHITQSTYSSCLQHLLPHPSGDQSLISTLGISQTYPRVFTRTKRYICSFIQYALNHYQHKISTS